MRHNWTYKKLTDVCGIQYGFPFDSHCFTDDSSFPPLIRIRDVVRGFSETFYNGDVPEDYYVKAGEYLIGMDGEFNIAPWRSEKALLNQRVCKIYSSDTSTSIHFIYYSLIKLLKQIEAETPSVTVKHLSAKRLNQIELPIPSLDEQRSIVQELDGINHLIDLQEQQLCEYDNLAQSLFYSTFGDPLTNPQGWDMKKLGEVAEIVGGSTPKTSEEKNWIGTNNWISPAEIKDDDKYISSTERCISDDAASHLQLLPIGTVLLSSRAPIGKLAITRIPMYCNQGFKNIVCGKTLNNEYAYWYMKFNVGRLQEMGVGATFKEVSKTIVSAFPIMLPPIELQQSFAAQIEAIEKQKALIRKSLDETRTLLAARMQYYFE